MREPEPEDHDALQELTQRICALDGQQAIAAVNEALRDSPGSAQLHFLRGSLFAEDGDHASALADFQAATDLAPDFSIASFQLGLLQLCLGNSEQAKRIWARLDRLETQDCLRLFKEGLCHIADERLREGVEWLKAGQEANLSFPPLNRDMQLLIDRAQERLQQAGDQPAEEGLHLLLSGYLGRSTKH